MKLNWLIWKVISIIPISSPNPLKGHILGPLFFNVSSPTSIHKYRFSPPPLKFPDRPKPNPFPLIFSHQSHLFPLTRPITLPLLFFFHARQTEETRNSTFLLPLQVETQETALRAWETTSRRRFLPFLLV